MIFRYVYLIIEVVVHVFIDWLQLSPTAAGPVIRVVTQSHLPTCVTVSVERWLLSGNREVP